MRRQPRRHRILTVFSVVALVATLLVLGSSVGTASAGPAPVMTGYVPLPANQFDTALVRAKSTSGTNLAFTVGITNAASGAVIYYDEWEDGYEADIANPVQSTTKVFGDANSANGDAADVTWSCGAVCAGDLLPTGAVLKKTSSPVATPRVASTVVPDGRDKVASTRGFSLVAGGYPTAIGSVIAGVVSSYDTSKYGLDYVVPVGVNTWSATGSPSGTNNPMNTASVIVGAAQNGTTVSIDTDGNGTADETTTLNEGETYLSTSSTLQQGARVLANKPVQVHLSTGDTTQSGAPAESRWYTLFPTPLLTADYLSPVGSSVNNQRTILYAYNPNPTAITVTPTCGSGCTAPAAQSIAAGAVGWFASPTGRAMRLTSTLPFAALGANGSLSGHQQFDDGADPGADESANYDSGFTLIPTGLLTTQAVLSWAPGNSSIPPSSSASDLDDNPIWVTTLAATTIYVDFDGNPATSRGGSFAGTGTCTGEVWDTSFPVSALTSTKISDTVDGDMTGARIATCDGSTKIAGAWAEDAAVAPIGSPGFDAGYTIIPTTTMVVDKSAASAVDANGDGKIGPGDTLQYDVAIADAGALAFSNVKVLDGLPVGTTYVNDSTVLVNGATTYPIADDVSGTRFPLDTAGGVPIPGGGGVNAGATVHVRYQLQINNSLPAGQTSVVNTVSVTSNEASASDTNTTPLAVSDLSLTKTLQTATPIYVGQNVTYRVTVTNAGPDAVNGVEVTDQIPAGTSFVSSTAGGAYNSATGVWTAGNLTGSSPGNSATMDITVTVNTTSAVTNVAQVTKSGSADPDSQPDENVLGPGNAPDQDDEASVSLTPSASADLSLAKTVLSGPDAGGNVSFRVTVSNAGPSTATNVTVQDYPPSGSTFVSLDGSSNGGGWSTPANTFSFLPIGANSTASFDVTYHVTTFPSTNYAQVTGVTEHDPDSNPDSPALSSANTPNQDDEASADISGQPDLSLTKSASSVQYAGDDVTYTVTLTNGGSVAATGVVVTDQLPAGVALVSAAPSQGTYNPATGAWTVGTVNPAAVPTLTIVGKPVAPGTYVNTAEVTAQNETDADSTPNNHVTTEDDQDDASITVTGMSIGDRVWYDVDGDGVQDAGEPGIAGATVTVRWAGVDGALNTIDDVVDFTGTGANGAWSMTGLPSGPYSVTVSSLPNGLTSPTSDLDGIGTANVASFTVAGGGNRTDIDFGYRGSGVVGDRIFNDANTNDAYDAGEGIDGVSVIATWAGPDATFGTGDDVTYPTATTATDGLYGFANLPSGPIRVAVQTATLPAGLIPSFDPDGGTADESTVTLTTGGSRLDQDLGYVPGHVDVAITKTDGTTTVNPGSTVSYTLGYSNGGAANQAASGVVITETVPANTTFNAGASTAGWVCTPNGNAGSTCTLSIGTVAIGGSGSVTFAVTASSTIPAGVTSLVNTATIVDDGTHGTDLTPSNNSATDTDSLLGAPDLTVMKSDGGASVSPGGIATYTLSYGNVGNKGATGVVLTETVGANSNFVAGSSTAGWSCTPSNGSGSTCTLAIGALAAGGTGTATFAVRADYPMSSGVTQLANTASIADDGTNGTDPDTSNNSSSDTTPLTRGTLGDRIFLDVNGNNAYDAGEGLNNVSVQVIWAGPDDVLGNGDDVLATVNTDSTGFWTATGLPAGNLRVNVVTATLPAGLTNTVDPNGGNDSTADVALAAGGTDLNQDFGYRGTGSIGDVVWRDVDGDGVQDGGSEVGLAGVTVTAVWPGPDGDPATTGDNQTWTTTTNGSGAYTLANLPAGTYAVTVTGTPPGTAPTYDLDGTGTPGTASVVLAAGQTRTDVDFGYRSGGVVGDTVFLDLNGNGTQDVGDDGVGGVTVTLSGNYDGNPDYETVIGTTTTDPSGAYSFTGVDAIPVRATVTIPTGYGSSTPTTVDHTMGTNETFDGADFGLLPGTITGHAFFDDDDSGTDNTGDSPIADVTVTLMSGSTVVATTTTDPSGDYVFRGLVAGSYTVVFTAPDGQVFTIPNVGADDTVDSDADPSTGATATVVVGAGTTVNDVDAGLYDVGSLSGAVYTDLDNDGVRDSGETGISGVTVTLTGTDDLDGPVLRTTTTDVDGNYVFENLRSGSYTLTETQPAGLLDGKDTAGSLDGTVGNDVISNIDVTPGDDGTGYLFGELPTTSLSGTVFEDLDGDGVIDAGEPGIAGVGVTLTGTDDLGNPVNLSTATDVNGTWTFTNLRPGTYTVTESTPTGYTDGKDAAGTAAGTVGANSGVGSDSITAIVLGAGTTATGYTFGEVRPGSIGDRVWDDTDGDGVQDGGEPGLVGVTVTLSGTDFAGNAVSTSTTTGTDGAYVFENLLPGSYTVTADASTAPAGYLPSPASGSNTTTTALQSNQELTTIDFGFRPPSGTIGDTVFSDTNGNGVQDSGEPGLGNVMVAISGPNLPVGYTTSQLTSGAGTYAFLNLPPGTYTVTVTTPSGLTATTATTMDRTIAQDEVVSDVDFGFTPPPAPPAGTIGDLVFNDANGNGVQDPGEVGVGGATVTLRIDSDHNGSYETVGATQSTASDGTYSFGNLPPGSYEVVLTVPAGQHNTTPTAIPVTLVSGQSVTDADFGVSATPAVPGTIGDTVFDDTDTNGVQDGSEVGLPGATVTLRQDTDGDGTYETVVTTTTSDADGHYTFTGVAPGSYTVTVTVPSGLNPTTPTTVAVPVSAGQTIDDVDFGLTDNQVAPGSISGHVWSDTDRDTTFDPDEPGVNGVTVTLLQDVDGDGVFETVVDTAVSAGNGDYSFPGLPPGSYRVVVDPPAGQSVTTAGSHDVVVTPGGVVTDVDFGLATPGAVPFDLQLTKTASGDTTPGGTITWLLTATNNGITPTPDPVTLTDVLPTGLTFVSASGQGWSCSATGQTVTCTLAQSIAVGASTELTIVTTVGDDVVPGTRLTNNATVSANGVELTLTNNSDDAFAEVLASEVDAPTPTPTPTTPTTPSTPSSGPLPATGDPSARMALFGLVLLGAGATLLGLRRRSQRRTVD